MRGRVAAYLHALAAAQADTTSLFAADKARACKKARRELAAELVDGDAGVALAVETYRWEQAEADRQRRLTDAGDPDGWRLRGCGGTFVSDAGGL